MGARATGAMGFSLFETAAQLLAKLTAAGKATTASTADVLVLRTAGKAIAADVVDVSSLAAPGAGTTAAVLLSADVLGDGETDGPYANGISRHNDGHYFFNLVGGAANDSLWSCGLAGDDFRRFRATAAGLLRWGPGTVDTDANLYRDAAGVLKTDGALKVAGAIYAGTKTWAAVSGTFTLDPTQGSEHRVQLTGNVTTLTITAGTWHGQKLLVLWEQDGTGGRTLPAWPSVVRWSDDLASATIASGAGKRTRMGLSWHDADGKWDVLGFNRGYQG